MIPFQVYSIRNFKFPWTIFSRNNFVTLYNHHVYLSNNILQTNQKSLTSEALFKGKIKELFLALENEVQYF